VVGDYGAIQEPHLDFSADGGFDRAVEMCNGAGICRKRTTGTMCPSFMVTREEEHSTRGRANLLRAALSGRLPKEELTGPRIYEAMDLCIECKACKAECPSAVDMAKIKFEYLTHYYEANGVPLRARLFANIGSLSAMGSGPQALASNWVVQHGLMLFARPALGITNKRPLPMLSKNPLPGWFKKHKTENGKQKTENDSEIPRVALFHDPFTNYNQPEVGIAAVEFLEVAGYEVIWPDHQGDGRPYISKGLVKEAKQMADETLSILVPLAEQGIPIVGLEPSSLLSLRDDYFFLLPDDPRVPLVAEHAYTFEEFVARLADDKQLDLTFTEEPRHILLHGHCHQKALVGTGPAIRALTLPPNYTLTEVDTSCCGMAGSFGYEAEHYEISMRMAERRLLPAVREASMDTIVVAAGISCRQQIKHGARRQALHPAQVLREAIIVD
jgi:Fe-S oxidoreductase